MKLAVISDIHSNLEAFTAVLRDIEEQRVDRIYCVGDIIGYGPDPCGCLDLVMERCQICLLGNHDQAALFDPKGFNPSAEEAIIWTRDQIDAARKSDDYWEFLGTRNPTLLENDFLFAHGSPSNPLNEYLFPEDVYSGRNKLERNFAVVHRCAFVGHTHVPGIFTSPTNFMEPGDLRGSGVYELPRPGRKAIINVGSVGQPRDGDPRACYAILDDSSGSELLTYRRIEYPIEETIRKINDLPISGFLGERLLSGH
ncbi:MAG: metallophosphoesterase family protein [Planctomycetia bacterium]|nr:metallophosphoesterase family protein [Planctomycetia bacterium]